MATMFRLDDRMAVVTGGGSGLGREIARAFVDAGADVVVLDRDSDALDASSRRFADWRST